MTKRMRLSTFIGVALVSGSLLIASTGFADAVARYSEQLGLLRTELATQTDADAAGIAQDDIAKVTSWLEEAETKLAERDTEAASYLLKRSEYGLDLIRNLTVVSQIEAKAEAQEKSFAQADEQVATLKAEVEALNAKKADLQQQLNQLR